MSTISKLLTNLIVLFTTIILSLPLPLTHMKGHSQLPNSLLVLLVNIGVGLGGSDHLCPAHCLLELHEAFLVLVPLHQHSGHFYSGEPLALGHRNILLPQRVILLYCHIIVFYHIIMNLFI